MIKFGFWKSSWPFCRVVEPLHELTEALTENDKNENSLTFSRKASGSLETQKLQSKNTAQWKKINQKAGELCY